MENLLVKIANPTSQLVHFLDDKNANAILNDLDNYAYILSSSHSPEWEVSQDALACLVSTI